jgi:putative ABC transport system permease protein
LLFGLQANDPLTFLTAGTTLAVVALGASYFPARRASVVDPAIALRQE